MADNLSSRRSFLFKTSRFILSTTLATSSNYILGLAVKNVDGSMVAGAKQCNPPTKKNQCPWGYHNCGPGWLCDHTTGTWIDMRDCNHKVGNPCP